MTYPNIQAAILFVESFIEGPILNDMRQDRIPPHAAIMGCKELAKVESGSDKIELVRKRALVEMDHPEFRTYIAGKLGAV